MNESCKPGVMIYFEILGILEMLKDTEKGILFETILRYAKDGIEPNPDKLKRLMLVWPGLKMRLDVDDQRYSKVVTDRKYAAYVRWMKKKGRMPLDFDAWVKSGGPNSKETYADPSDALA